MKSPRVESLIFRRAWRAHRRDLLFAGFFATAASLLLLPVPLLLPLLIDEVLLGHPGRLTAFFRHVVGDGRVWVMIAGVTTAIVLLRLGAFALHRRKVLHATRAAQETAYELRSRILAHLRHLDLSEYESLHTGGTVSRSVQDVEQVAALVQQAATQAFGAASMTAGTLAMLFWIQWELALAVLLFHPLFWAFGRWLGRRSAAYLRRRQQAFQRYYELLTETLEMFVQVRASNQECRYFDLIRSRARKVRDSAVEYGAHAATVQGISGVATATMVDLFRAGGIAAVAYMHLSLGMMIAFLFYLATLNAPMQQLLGLLISYRGTRPAMERIDALLRLRREPEYPHEIDPFAGRESVEIDVRRLRFGYDRSHKAEILHGIDLRVAEGEKVAIVGASGSGKSTVAQLLVGFYRPWEGEILYGGVPISRIGLEPLRRHVSLMLQESLFFNDTIRNNLTLGRELSDERIYEALSAAQMGSFVRNLERGLDTPVGKNGIRLSGGQRQRLAIARVILADPKVVIFDEATSALDGETEARLYRSLAPFLEGRTTLIIAHRETTIRQADRIYVLEAGKVVAEGDYEALRRRGWIRKDYDDEQAEGA